MSGLSRLRPLAARLLSLRRLSSRAYGSAAAQLQYDSDYYDEEEQQLQQYGLVGTEGSVPGRGVKWVLIGHRGVQRRLYAERLSKLLEIPHISMGSLVRQELHPRSSLYKQIANAVNEGKLVPEEIIFTLLSRRLEEGYCRGETGFILDGIPRTRMQAEILDQIADIDLVVNFKCTEDHMVKNNLGAGNFSPCCEYLSMSNAGCNLNLMFQNKQLKTSPADIGGPWKEKFHIYSEQLGFVGTAEEREPSINIEAKGEFNSSSSSSLVYDFLSTEDPLLLRLDWLPPSPIIFATETAEGGE